MEVNLCSEFLDRGIIFFSHFFVTLILFSQMFDYFERVLFASFELLLVRRKNTVGWGSLSLSKHQFLLNRSQLNFQLLVRFPQRDNVFFKLRSFRMGNWNIIASADRIIFESEYPSLSIKLNQSFFSLTNFRCFSECEGFSHLNQ